MITTEDWKQRALAAEAKVEELEDEIKQLEAAEKGMTEYYEDMLSDAHR